MEPAVRASCPPPRPPPPSRPRPPRPPLPSGSPRVAEQPSPAPPLPPRCPTPTLLAPPPAPPPPPKTQPCDHTCRRAISLKSLGGTQSGNLAALLQHAVQERLLRQSKSDDDNQQVGRGGDDVQARLEAQVGVVTNLRDVLADEFVRLTSSSSSDESGDSIISKITTLPFSQLKGKMRQKNFKKNLNLKLQLDFRRIF